MSKSFEDLSPKHTKRGNALQKVACNESVIRSGDWKKSKLLSEWPHQKTNPQTNLFEIITSVKLRHILGVIFLMILLFGDIHGAKY